MSESPDRGRRLSVQEYLEFEERSELRHEYVGGYVRAMGGATARHNEIAFNVAAYLRAAATGGPCRVFISDMKVRVDERFYYPDVVTICKPFDGDDVYLTEPCLIVEVTSRSTRSTDRGGKLASYGRLPSLQAYLIVDHRRRFVEWHVPDTNGLRLHGAISGDGVIDVPCPRTALTLDTIYENVTLPTVRERAASYRS